MGTQTMASQTSGRQQSPVQSLTRQGSLYSLTLNEVQSHLGEPLHSMNLDDLLKNVFAADGNPYLSMDIESTAGQFNSSGSGLQRQGSITMNRSLSKKTVDEIWRDIQQKRSCDGRSSNLGEMTLEDFLLKAGVVAEGMDKSNGVGNVGFSQEPHWLHQYHRMSIVHQQQPRQRNAQQVIGAYVPGHLVPQPLGVGTSAILEAVYPEGQVGMSSPGVGAISDPQTPGRKRGAREDIKEKTVERRQKRMIKNRESAARSRARKQAYTNELENKVLRLEEENESLRKQKELDTILHSAPSPEPKHQLRRSSSAPF